MKHIAMPKTIQPMQPKSCRRAFSSREWLFEPRFCFTDHVLGEGERFFAEVERIGLEGMVAKKIDSVYVSGRSGDWLKIKTEVGRIEMEGRSEGWRG
jgi:ATP-dependent DNA ligase